MSWKADVLRHIEDEGLLDAPPFDGATTSGVVLLVRSVDGDGRYSWGWRRTASLSLQEHLGVMQDVTDQLLRMVVEERQAKGVDPFDDELEPTEQLGMLLAQLAHLRDAMQGEWVPEDPAVG